MKRRLLSLLLCALLIVPSVLMLASCNREGFIAVKEKIAFLKGMFDFTLIGRHREDTLSEEERDKMDYYSILSAIINAKWEA